MGRNTSRGSPKRWRGARASRVQSAERTDVVGQRYSKVLKKSAGKIQGCLKNLNTVGRATGRSMNDETPLCQEFIRMPPQHHDPPPIAQINQVAVAAAASADPHHLARHGRRHADRSSVLFASTEAATFDDTTLNADLAKLERTSGTLASSTSAPSLTRGSAGCATRARAPSQAFRGQAGCDATSSASGSSGTSGRSVRRARPRQTGDTRTRRDFDLSGFEMPRRAVRERKRRNRRACWSWVILLGDAPVAYLSQVPDGAVREDDASRKSGPGVALALEAAADEGDEDDGGERKDARRSRELDARRRTTRRLSAIPSSDPQPKLNRATQCYTCKARFTTRITFTRSCVPPAPR